MKSSLFWGLMTVMLLLSACDNLSGTSGRENQGADTTRMQLDELNREIALSPSNADLYGQRASLHLLDRQFDKALHDVNKAISINGDESSFYVILSDIYLLMGKPDESRNALNKALSKNPGDTQALLKLSKVYLIVQDYKNCYATVKQLLEIDNSIAAAYYTRAIGLLEQGDTIRAVDDLRQAVDKNQDYYEAYVQLGELYSIKKDPAAELYFKNALKLWPQSREALYMLGLFYQESGKYEDALAAYQALAGSDTTFRDAPYNQGYIYLVYLKDFAKAARFFTEAIAIDPEYFEAYYNRGYAYELAGDYPKAYQDYQKSLKIKVNYDKAVTGLNRLDKITGKE